MYSMVDELRIQFLNLPAEVRHVSLKDIWGWLDLSRYEEKSLSSCAAVLNQIYFISSVYSTAVYNNESETTQVQRTDFFKQH